MTAETFSLNVNAQDLINTAELFSESGAEISSLTSEMMSLVTGLSSAWSGDASSAYISKFQMLDDDMEKMLGMISEHVSDLEEMAANYLEGESFGIDQTESLSTDVIV